MARKNPKEPAKTRPEVKRFTSRETLDRSVAWWGCPTPSNGRSAPSSGAGPRARFSPRAVRRLRVRAPRPAVAAGACRKCTAVSPCDRGQVGFGVGRRNGLAMPATFACAPSHARWPAAEHRYRGRRPCPARSRRESIHLARSIKEMRVNLRQASGGSRQTSGQEWASFARRPGAQLAMLQSRQREASRRLRRLTAAAAGSWRKIQQANRRGARGRAEGGGVRTRPLPAGPTGVQSSRARK